MLNRLAISRDTNGIVFDISLQVISVRGDEHFATLQSRPDWPFAGNDPTVEVISSRRMFEVDAAIRGDSINISAAVY